MEPDAVNKFSLLELHQLSSRKKDMPLKEDKFSTRRLFSREATFSFVGIAFADVISDADKGKSRYARKKLPSGKRALGAVKTRDLVQSQNKRNLTSQSKIEVP